MKDACFKFVKLSLNTGFVLDVLKNQPLEVWSLLLTEPFEYVTNEHGVRLDVYEISLFATKLLYQICEARNEMSEFPKYFKQILGKTKARGFYHIGDSLPYSNAECAIAACLSETCTRDQTRVLQRFNRKFVNIQNLNLDSIRDPELAQTFENMESRSYYPWPKNIFYMDKERLGIHLDVNIRHVQGDQNGKDTEGHPFVRWSLEGCIRKLEVITRY